MERVFGSIEDLLSFLQACIGCRLRNLFFKWTMSEKVTPSVWRGFVDQVRGNTGRLPERTLDTMGMRPYAAVSTRSCAPPSASRRRRCVTRRRRRCVRVHRQSRACGEAPPFLSSSGCRVHRRAQHCADARPRGHQGVLRRRHVQGPPAPDEHLLVRRGSGMGRATNEHQADTCHRPHPPPPSSSVSGPARSTLRR